MPITVNDLERTVNSGLTTSVKKSEINFKQLFVDVNVENLTSTIKIPMRSKYCKRCENYVSKFDHHCFWIGRCKKKKFFLKIFF